MRKNSLRRTLLGSLSILFLSGSLALGQNPNPPPLTPAPNPAPDGTERYARLSFSDTPPVQNTYAPLVSDAVAPPVVSGTVAPDPNCWTGFYAGINGGGGFGVGSTEQTAEFSSKLLGTNGLLSNSGRYSPVGGNLGGQLGYNRQMSCFLIGVEADWEWASQRESTNNSTSPATLPFFGAGANGFGYSLTEQHEVTEFGTARLRSGVIFNNSLLYLTGGLAWGTVKDSLDFRGSANNLIFPAALQPGPFLPSEASFTHTCIGWTAGAGVETKLSTHWSLKLEYIFVDLGTVSQTMPIRINPAFGPVFNSGTASATSKWVVTDNIFRIGLNYKF